MWNSFLPLKKVKKRKKGKKIIEEKQKRSLTSGAMYVIYVRACVRAYTCNIWGKKIFKENNKKVLQSVLLSCIVLINKSNRQHDNKKLLKKL